MLNPLRLLRPLSFLVGIATALTMPMVSGSPALAQGAGCNAGTLCIDLSPRNFKPMPIAIVDFTGEAGQGAQVASVITNNLKRSGVFEPLDRARFPEQNVAFDATPNFAAWQGIGAQAVLNGRVVREGGRLAVEYRLWEVSTGKAILGQRHGVDAAAWRRLAHLASDAVFERLTGETGFFDTRIVFVDETGPKDKRRKRLAIMDQDGANFLALSSGDELLVTPRYSPRGDRVAFMAFGNGRPRVQVLDLGTGQRNVIGQDGVMSFAPRFAPNAGTLAMSIENNGQANIVAVDLGSRAVRPLTSGGAIDTSPSYSPDGSQIVFESDRGGGQQLYVMGADGGGARRISFGEGRYSTPVWSPKGDFIAFTKQRGGNFAIGIMKPDGSGERILTEGFHNEGPSWAPNGRYIVFFRESGAGAKLHMVDITGRVDVPIPTPNFASDPAWSPLRSAR
ncbi:MAG: Tol-Pal system beta propeller repeat protein TolB [Beijerinckiaceae bacterium]|jgi:TolB protein|nr:Tol-Pal system beta propeller repeat protein TolB [Beijerinckiaceae bacterium]